MDSSTNLINPDLFVDHKGPPHRLFDLWRAQKGLHWNPPNPDYVAKVPFSTMNKGFFVLTRYQDVFEVSRDQERFSSYDEGFVIWDQEGPGLDNMRANFMGMRPPDHSAVKRVITPPFSPKAMLEIGPTVERLAAELIGEISALDSCEFVFDVAAKLPVYTFCELMGVPLELRDQVVKCGNAMADVESRDQLDFDPREGLASISRELTENLRCEPDASLMSAIVNDSGLALEQNQIDHFFQVFAIAGHETTRSTASHFVNLMSQHPEQRELLLSDLDQYLDNAIEEVLRYTSTTTNFRRTATCETTIGNCTVQRGDKLVLSYAAANRDPQMFADPHRFDITRDNARKHLAFGTGPHVCTGARLARLQLRALLKELFTRLPDIHPIDDPQWLRSIWFNAIIRMPVSFAKNV